MDGGRLRVGVVGGGVGRAHIRAYKSLPERFEVVALCDIDGAKARDLATEFDIPRISTDLDEVCRMEDVDVIDICTPSYLHATQTLRVLAAGKHAVCEKLIAGSLKEVDGLIEAEARSGRRVMPIFQYRFEPQPEGFEGQFLRFHRALQEEADPPVTLHDARNSLELITAIYHSAQTGQGVELPLGKDHPKYASWRP